MILSRVNEYPGGFIEEDIDFQFVELALSNLGLNNIKKITIEPNLNNENTNIEKVNSAIQLAEKIINEF